MMGASLPQAMSPDGEAIVTGAGDETLRFWNVFSKTRSTKVSGWVGGCRRRCSPCAFVSSSRGVGARYRPSSLFTRLCRNFPWGSPHPPSAAASLASQPGRPGHCAPACVGALGTNGARVGPSSPQPGFLHCGSAAPPVCPAGVRVRPQPLHQDPVNLGPRRPGRGRRPQRTDPPPRTRPRGGAGVGGEPGLEGP